MDVQARTHLPVRDKREIFRLLAQEQLALQAPGVQRLGLFGSFVLGEQHAGSGAVEYAAIAG